MPRFFFDIVGPDVIEDLEGTDLPSLAQARAAAIKDARALMSAAVLAGRDVSDRWVEIRDREGVVHARIPFKAAVRRGS